jgi:predicted MFS family arabinose efflux permease
VAEVFVSYKREERQAVERIATTLRGLGISVWFDASMSAGEAFSDEIDREAHGAKAILVCWSPTARDSQWVKSEALIGFEKSKLAACYVAGPDGFYPPTPFNSIHAEDLRAWLAAPSDAHSGWKSILRRVGKLCERPDIESYGALDVQASAAELNAWLRAHASSPLFIAVEALLRAREAEEGERTRLEQEARERHAREEQARRAREEQARREREAEERAEALRRPKPTPIADTRFTAVDTAAPNAVATIIVLALAWFASRSTNASLVAVFVPVRDELALVDSQLNLVAWQLPTLAMVLIGLIAGILADRRGVNRAHLVAAGVLLTALATLAMMFVDNFPQLAAVRLVQGAGSGLVIAPALAMAGSLSSLRHRALALAVVALGGWGSSWVSSLVRMLASEWDWRAVQGLFGAVALAVALLVFLVARDPPHLRQAPTHSSRVLSTPMIWLLLAVALHGALLSASNWFDPHLAQVLAAPFAEVVERLNAAGLAGIIGLVAGALIGDAGRGNPRRYVSVFLIGTLLTGITLALFAVMTNLDGATALAGAFWFFGAAWYGVALAVALRLSGPGKAGIAVALVFAVQIAALNLSPMAFGALSDALGANEDRRVAFLIWSALAVVTAIALLFVHATMPRRVAEVEGR